MPAGPRRKSTVILRPWLINVSRSTTGCTSTQQAGSLGPTVSNGPPHSYDVDMSSLFQRIAHRYRTTGSRWDRSQPGPKGGHPCCGCAPRPEHHESPRAAGPGQSCAGQHIGKTDNDPLYEFLTKPRRPGRSRFEPYHRCRRDTFDQLQHNYAGVPGVICENVAVADRTGEIDFYSLGVNPEEHGHPAWLAQLGSLKAERTGALLERCEANPDLPGVHATAPRRRKGPGRHAP